MSYRLNKCLGFFSMSYGMCFPPRRCMEKSGFKLIDPHTGNFIANVVMHKKLQKTPWFQKHINFPGDGAKISFLRSLQYDFNQNECECLTIALSSLSRTQEIHVLEKSSYTLCKIVHKKSNQMKFLSTIRLMWKSFIYNFTKIAKLLGL